MAMRGVFLAAVLFLPLFLMQGEVRAQTAAPAAAPAALPDRIIRPMRAIDPITLRAEGVTIRLWGVRPAQSYNTPLELRALELIENLIQEQQVNCKIVGGVMPELVARCATQSNQDLALELLGNGYAVVDRRQTYDSVFASAYEKAQENARVQTLGVWDSLLREKKAADLPVWVQNRAMLLMIVAGVPLLGFLVMAGMLWLLARRMLEGKSGDNAQTQMKEARLQQRERQVLLSLLEGELVENKNKTEAFLVIYGDMLQSLKDGAETPKYQQVGDIIQKHPSFSKTIFETNMSRLSVLDIKLAGHISKTYASLPKEQEYINLDQNVPLDTAIKLVEKVIREAEESLQPINQILLEIQSATTAQA